MQPVFKKKHSRTKPETPPDWVEWVEKAAAGNTRAFERLASLFHDGIFRMVYFRTRSTMDAEDLTQEIFVKAFQNLGSLKEAERFKSWLFSIAANRVRDFHRKKKLQNLFRPFTGMENNTLAENEQEGTPEAINRIEKQNFWNQVESLLNKLSGLEREAFLLRFMDHLSIREISQVMKKNENTVKTHLYRAIGKFKKEPSLLEFLEDKSL